jgi:hypothetical protein
MAGEEAIRDKTTVNEVLYHLVKEAIDLAMQREPPPVSVKLLGFLFQPAVVDPIKKSLSKLPENRRLAWKRIGVFHDRS